MMDRSFFVFVYACPHLYILDFIFWIVLVELLMNLKLGRGDLNANDIAHETLNVPFGSISQFPIGPHLLLELGDLLGQQLPKLLFALHHRHNSRQLRSHIVPGRHHLPRLFLFLVDRRCHIHVRTVKDDLAVEGAFFEEEAQWVLEAQVPK